MLYRLEIENFFSVRDPQVLDLRVPGNTPDDWDRFAPLFPGSTERVAKVVSLFGPNGSGKTTVLRALAFMRWFIRDSFAHTGHEFPCAAFHAPDGLYRPVRLALEGGGRRALTRAARTPEAAADATDFGTSRYELELRAEPRTGRVMAQEALRHRPLGKGKWQRVFERREDGVVLGSRTFPLAGFARITDKIRSDASVVSTLAQFDHEASQVLRDIANAMLVNLLIDPAEPDDQGVVALLAGTPSIVEALNREIQRIDLGVRGMRIVTTPNGPLPVFTHEGLGGELLWQQESHGTRSFIRTFPMLFAALSVGGVAVMDELDKSIHPVLLPEILRWFRDPARNPHGAQLWMSSHAASLLDELVKEEIVLCEKDATGASRLYSLMDLAAVRRGDNLYKKYLGGTYGAVPHIG